MNLQAFARDIKACARSPWLASHRMKAFRALAIERWNEYSPVKWRGDLQVAITRGQSEWRLPMRTSSDDCAAFRETFLYGYYDHDLGQPATILDLGGYCGYTAIAFSARFPQARIAAVEPHPGNFATLTANIKLNNLPVTLFQAAATVTDGPVSLYLRSGMTHGLMPTYHSTGDAITVEGLSVPTILARLGWDRADLLKIDIEGAEELLFGAHQPWLAGVQTIIGEYHGAYQIPELRSDLESRGFNVIGLPHRNIFVAGRNHLGTDRK
jgi:FkbM family methyltransferase